jgi:hypothetical protein
MCSSMEVASGPLIRCAPEPDPVMRCTTRSGAWLAPCVPHCPRRSSRPMVVRPTPFTPCSSALRRPFASSPIVRTRCSASSGGRACLRALQSLRCGVGCHLGHPPGLGRWSLRRHGGENQGARDRGRRQCGQVHRVRGEGEHCCGCPCPPWCPRPSAHPAGGLCHRGRGASGPPCCALSGLGDGPRGQSGAGLGGVAPSWPAGPGWSGGGQPSSAPARPRRRG